MSSGRQSPELTSIFRGRQPPLTTSAHESLYNFLALPNFLSAHSHFPCSLVNRRSSYSLSTNHLSCGFQSSSYSELCFRKPPPSAMPSADWFQHRDVTRRGSASDARTTQISSQNIHASRKASTQANAMQQLLSY